MKKWILVLSCVLALSACQKARELRADWGARMGLLPPVQSDKGLVEGSAYYNFPEISPGKQYKSESTFCYKVQTDILCYDQPRPGWEDRMIGYQEPLRPARAQNNAAPQPAGAPFAATAPVGEVSQASVPPLPRSTLTMQ